MAPVVEKMWVVVEVVADDPRVRAAVFTKARAIKLALKYDAEPGAGPMYVLPYKPLSLPMAKARGF